MRALHRTVREVHRPVRALASAAAQAVRCRTCRRETAHFRVLLDQTVHWACCGICIGAVASSTLGLFTELVEQPVEGALDELLYEFVGDRLRPHKVVGEDGLGDVRESA